MRAPQWLLEVVVLSVAVWLCVSKPTDKRSSLLPPSLNPEHYDLSLAPRLDKGVFTGVVVITGVAVKEVDRIVLHCKDLLFNTTNLTDLTTDEELEVEDIQEDSELERCHLLLNQSLQVDHEYQLNLEFMGVIYKDGVGLYRDYYWEEGVKHDILMTHFQPNFARAMFPCFDEPHYKAQFLLRVTRQHFPTVLSNMPVSAALPDPEEDNRTWVEFEETPPMSTYLLVLVMSDYISLTDSSSNTSVWAPRDRLHEAQLALNVSVAVLEECDRYFGTPYALPKLDHIPVPTLSTVAMENWGAITYKKEFLLWEEGVSTWAQREMISHVICHEVVHQWLGNLVTTGWWNTTWLNEGVTSFYHYYIMDKVEPSWQVMDTLFVTQIQVILNEEATRDPKPLTYNEPLTQEAISTFAFSISTYLKGAAIVRMVFNLMPPDIFREAIMQYIIDNEYGSVDEEDLWQSLEAVADLPVDLEAVMYSWTHQPGYPLVTVHRAEDGCISVRQEKYLAKDETDARWTIPLTFTTSDEQDFNYSSTKTVWFPEDQSELHLGVCLEPTDWIILNIRHSGFYRVNYDTVTWDALTASLQEDDLSTIHFVSRAQLLHDGFDLAAHGLLPYPTVLGLSRYLRRETEYLPWVVATQWFNWLCIRLYQTDFFRPFQRYTLDLVEDVFNQTPLKGDAGGLIPEFHRKQVVEFACGLRHPRCVKEATDTAYLLMSGVNVRIPLDLKPVLLCTAVRHGQDEVWHFVLKEYLGASQQDRWKYLVALACTSKKDIVNRLLKDVTEPLSFVKSMEERLNLLMELGKQDDNLEYILDMVQDKFKDLSANFDFEVILQLLKSFITTTPTDQERKKMNAIAAMVIKTKSTKHIEIMESIISDMDRLDFKPLHDGSVKEWFTREVQEQEEVVLTPSPPPTQDPEAEEDAETTMRSVVEGEPTEEPSEEDVDEYGSDDDDGDHGEDSDDVPDSSIRQTSSWIYVALVLFFCVMR